MDEQVYLQTRPPGKEKKQNQNGETDEIKFEGRKRGRHNKKCRM